MELEADTRTNSFILLKQGAEAEARCMTKARRLGVCTPVLYAVDPVLHALTFEFVEGPSVKDIFLEFGLHGVNEEQLDHIASQIGDAIGKIHDGGLVHGDLTTSNMLLKNGTNQLVLIDFGLSFTSTLPEDKAVDLYVMERALLSMHSSCGNVMDRILAAYRKSSKQWSSTLNKPAQGERTFSLLLVSSLDTVFKVWHFIDVFSQFLSATKRTKENNGWMILLRILSPRS